MDIQDEFRAKGQWDGKELDPVLCEIIATRIAVEFAEWCVITQAFGLYGYGHSFEIFKKEKGY